MKIYNERQKNRNALVTLAIGSDSESILALTGSSMRRYAECCSCDFVVIDTPKVKAGFVKFEKFQIYDLLTIYDRIIFLDVDVLVMPKCPDLMQIVPLDRFGAFFDSNGGNGCADIPEAREDEINSFQSEYGDIGWTRTYFNSGVMIVPAEQRDVFAYSDRLFRGKRFIDQTLLNYRLQKYRYPWFDIGQRFNHFAALSRSTLLFESRFESSIIHYAGFAEFYPDRSLRKQISADLEFVYGSPSKDSPVTVIPGRVRRSI